MGTVIIITHWSDQYSCLPRAHRPGYRSWRQSQQTSGKPLPREAHYLMKAETEQEQMNTKCSLIIIAAGRNQVWEEPREDQVSPGGLSWFGEGVQEWWPKWGCGPDSTMAQVYTLESPPLEVVEIHA